MKFFEKDKLPPRGDFAFQQLVSPYQVTAEALADNRGFYGLLKSKGMPFGSVRSEDGEIFSMVRALMAPTGTQNPVNFLFLSTLIDKENIRIDQETTTKQARTELPVSGVKDGKAFWHNQPGDTGNHWRVEANDKVFHWKEDNLFELNGELLGSGFQWYLPGVDWGTFYVSQMYSVKGEVMGRKVKGIISSDQVYLAEGGAIHSQKDLIVNNQMHVVWWNFATVYKDGTHDVGSFLVGHDNLGFAIIMDETGRIRTSYDIEGEAKHKHNSYFAESAKVVIDGEEEWEFIPDPRGEMTDFVGGFPPTAQQEGRWRRVGDTREPDHWMAWGETDRRNGTARNVRGTDFKPV